MSNLADRITRDLMERTVKAYERFQRRFNIEWLDELPQDWLADTPHSVPPCDISIAFANPADAMEQVAELYREALWADADVRFEIWQEEDASDGYAPIAGLYACRGFNSLTFIDDTAEAIFYCDTYHARGADDRVAETLVKLADELILAQRLAVMPEQIAIWPIRPAQPPHGSFSVLPPDDVRDHVRQVIEEYLPFEEFEILRIAKESQRQVFHKWESWK